MAADPVRTRGIEWPTFGDGGTSADSTRVQYSVALHEVLSTYLVHVPRSLCVGCLTLSRLDMNSVSRAPIIHPLAPYHQRQ